MPSGRFTHGLFRKDPKLHSRWNSMISRCYRADDVEYARYGGSGVGVCDEWKTYAAFFEWALANGWNGLSLERKDYMQGYSPENCCWATMQEQARNRRSNRRIEFQGETHCMVEWAEKLNISYQVLKARFKNKWPIDRALMTPVRYRSKGG